MFVCSSVCWYFHWIFYPYIFLIFKRFLTYLIVLFSTNHPLWCSCSRVSFIFSPAASSSASSRDQTIKIIFHLMQRLKQEEPTPLEYSCRAKANKLQQTNKQQKTTKDKNIILCTWCNDSSNRSAILAKQFDNSILRRWSGARNLNMKFIFSHFIHTFWEEKGTKKCNHESQLHLYFSEAGSLQIYSWITTSSLYFSEMIF